MSAEVRLAEVRAMRIRAEQGVAVARAALRHALGLGEDRAFELVPPRIEPSPAPGDPEALVTEALAARQDLKSLDARLRQAETGTRIAKSRYVPEIGVGAAYELNGENPLAPDGSNWSAGVSLRIPIFEGTETGARVAKATADLDRVRAYREAMAEGIRLQVRAAWADRLAVAESALAVADEALRIVRDRYAEGMAVMVELLGAEASGTGARGNRAAASRDLALAAAALDLAVGRPLAPPPPAEER
jgi:outer membrane protein TolC